MALSWDDGKANANLRVEGRSTFTPEVPFLSGCRDIVAIVANHNGEERGKRSGHWRLTGFLKGNWVRKCAVLG